MIEIRYSGMAVTFSELISQFEVKLGHPGVKRSHSSGPKGTEEESHEGCDRS